MFINNIKRDNKRRRHNYREPSRIPIKALKKGLKRRNRRFVIKYILKSVPKSSFVYQIMKVASLQKTVVYSMRKAMEEYTCEQEKKRARAYINKYRTKDYLLRKIYHASHTKKRILLMGIYPSIKNQNARFLSFMNNRNRQEMIEDIS